MEALEELGPGRGRGREGGMEGWTRIHWSTPSSMWPLTSSLGLDRLRQLFPQYCHK